jgi:hypothetical protein
MNKAMNELRRRMIDADRLELIDTGDGVPLSKCEQNLYEALANVEDGWYYENDESLNHICRDNTFVRLEDAFADMGELVAEVKRLRKGIKAYLDLDIETSDLKELIE